MGSWKQEVQDRKERTRSSWMMMKEALGIPTLQQTWKEAGRTEQGEERLTSKVSKKMDSMGSVMNDVRLDLHRCWRIWK